MLHYGSVQFTRRRRKRWLQIIKTFLKKFIANSIWLVESDLSYIFVSACHIHVLRGQIIKPYPWLSVLYPLQLFLNFLLGVACALDYPPEIHELIILDLAVVVVVHSVEKRVGLQFPKVFRPMFDCLIFFNCFRTIFVKDLEHLIY